MATAATQQRAQQLGLKSKLAAPFGAKCSVRLKFFRKMKGDIEDRWVEGKYMGLSPSVNDGHVVLRNDGKGNGFVQTLHVRTKLFTPEPPPLEFVGDSVEPEHPPPRLRVRGKRALEELLGEDEVPPPLPPPAEAPRPEGFVLHSEEEEPLRVARVSLQVLNCKGAGGGGLGFR